MMRIRLAMMLMVAAALTAGARPSAQDGNGVYRTQFENDWVRVVRVRYPANAKVPTHGHPSTVTTYVYLSESSPVRFTHHGGRTHVVTRRPTVPGAFRVSRGGDETHEAENLGPIASDFLRVELKTDPAGSASPFYRDQRRLGAAATTSSDVRFTNAQLRITRVTAPGGHHVEVETTANAPALLVALVDGTASVDGSPLALNAGQERWIGPGRRERLTNTGPAPLELLRIDLLTPPRPGSAGDGR